MAIAAPILHRLLAQLVSNVEDRPVYKDILIATDGSELATKAVSHGLALAKLVGATVTIVTVTEMWSAMAVARKTEAGPLNALEQFERLASDSARSILEAALQLAQAQGVAAATLHVQDRHPAQGIIEAAANKGCDLIVMASHGRRGIDRVLMGSQAVEVLTHCKVPALIVR